jgi:hypothetical protein
VPTLLNGVDARKVFEACDLDGSGGAVHVDFRFTRRNIMTLPGLDPTLVVTASSSCLCLNLPDAKLVSRLCFFKCDLHRYTAASSSTPSCVP